MSSISMQNPIHACFRNHNTSSGIYIHVERYEVDTCRVVLFSVAISILLRNPVGVVRNDNISAGT